MKRKFKLMASVASLALAVTMLCFGVYAAATPKATINGSVSFTATNVQAVVTVKSGLNAARDVFANNSVTFDQSSAADINTTITVPKLELTDLIVTGGYTVEIKNNFKSGATAKVKIAYAKPADVNEGGVTITYVEDANWTTAVATGIEAQAVAKLTVTVTVDPALATGFANTTINVGTVTLSRV